MRGFGMPEIHFGIEQHIDQMAHKLGLDPVEVRLKNCLKDGDETLTGHEDAPDRPQPVHRARRRTRSNGGKQSPPSGPAQGARQGAGGHVEGACHAAEPRLERASSG